MKFIHNDGGRQAAGYAGNAGVGEWKRSLPMTKDETIKKAQGFASKYPFSVALVVNYQQSVNIGLPDAGT
jgi:hypothetical protein